MLAPGTVVVRGETGLGGAASPPRELDVPLAMLPPAPRPHVGMTLCLHRLGGPLAAGPRAGDDPGR
jgi:hypothetical protein